MTYLQRSSEIKKNKYRKLTIIAVVVIIFSVGTIFKSSTSSLVQALVSPINTVVDVVLSPFDNFTSYFASKKDLAEDNERLNEENKRLGIEILSLRRLESENIELKNILNIRDQGVDRVVSEVILTPPFSPFDTFVIKNPGNIAVGNFVYIKNILVGEISEVFENTAIAKLYSSYESKIPVRIGEETIGEASGIGGLSFEISLPKDLGVDESEPIYSMERPDSIIGFIDYIDSAETSSFKTIYFQYPFSFEEFRFVEVEI